MEEAMLNCPNHPDNIAAAKQLVNDVQLAATQPYLIRQAAWLTLKINRAALGSARG